MSATPSIDLLPLSAEGRIVYDAAGTPIIDAYWSGRAERITKILNAHEKLVEALRQVAVEMECQCHEAYKGRGRCEPNAKCYVQDIALEALREAGALE